MTVYEFSASGITPLRSTSFVTEGLLERYDIQRLLRDSAYVIDADIMVISEEFGSFGDSRRRVDLLAVDKNANLVVIELKRTEDGGDMDLQSIRYASMVSTLTFEQAVQYFSAHLARIGRGTEDGRAILLDYLGWEVPDAGDFAQNVRIILASQNFSREVTSTVLWLRGYGIDIRCVRLQPYKFEQKIFLDVQQLIPLPEAADYQIKIEERRNAERKSSRVTERDYTRFDVNIDGQSFPGLTKRAAIFRICFYVFTRGAQPEELQSLLSWRSNRVWYVVDGEVDSDDFNMRAEEKAAAGGPAFDARRWYCDEGELIHYGGKTYALSNQWGSESWRKAMTLLKERYGSYDIDFVETEVA